MRLWTSLFAVAFYMAASFSVSADETLASVLARLRVKQTNEYSYTETRALKLLNAPWKGEGIMYLSPDNMVIAQDTPKQSIVIIAGSSMRYVEPENNVRIAQKLEGDYALPGIGDFLQLLYGQHTADSLTAKFTTVFTQENDRWQITLTPKKEDYLRKMEMSGEADKGADTLQIEFTDGDSTNWKMQLENDGASAQQAMDEVLKLAASIKGKPEAGDH